VSLIPGCLHRERVPLADGRRLAPQRLAMEKLDAPHRVLSAGVWAADGDPASENAVATMAERGIDISDHRSHSLTTEEIAGAALILVIDPRARPHGPPHTGRSMPGRFIY